MIQNMQIKSEDMVFELELKSRLTLMNGDSGTGKTFLYKLMLDKARAEKDSRFIFFNHMVPDKKYIKSEILTHKDKIFVVDDADIILDKELKSLISVNTSNQYIIFTHSIDGYTLGKKNIAVLKIKNNKGVLEYPLLQSVKDGSYMARGKGKNGKQKNEKR